MRLKIDKENNALYFGLMKIKLLVQKKSVQG